MAGKRTVAYRLKIAWDGNEYRDESDYLISASGSVRLSAPNEPTIGGKGQVDRCVIELDNKTRRYSPLNEDSPLNDSTEEDYALVNGGAYNRPMYLEVSINGGAYSRIFTGVIKLPAETTPTGRTSATVKIDCRSMDELLLSKKMSTLLSAMQAWTDSGYTEGQMIEALLLNANVINYYTDYGMIVVPYVWLDKESPLDEIWTLASACGGRFYCDQDGYYRYEDSTHWLKAPHTTSQETITRDDFDTFSPSYDDGEIYNIVTVEASPRMIDASDVLWEPEAPISVPVGETKKVTAKLKQAAWQLDQIELKATTLGGSDITSSVTMSQTNYVQRVELAFTNNHASQAAYIRPLKITGKALKGGPTVEVEKNSEDDGFNHAWWASRLSERSKDIRSNVYVQTEAHAGAVALMLLHRYEKPHLTYKVGNVDGKPSRRLGDRITLQDAELMSNDVDAFITSISFTLNNKGFIQDLECIDAQELYPYSQPEGEGYFVIGTNKVGTGVGSAYCWY